MNERTRQIAARGVSRQSFGILPKVREIDEIVRSSPEARQSFIEVHPEVSFAAWAGHAMRHGKKSSEGKEERQRLIESHFGIGAFSKLHQSLRDVRVPTDDLADAFAGLWTAERVLDGSALSLPPIPEVDAEGLEMRIVY